MTGFDKYVASQGMTVIPISSTRISLTLPRTIFICNQILPRSMLARRKMCQWESWTSMAHRESDPETRHRLLPKTIGEIHVELRRESPRIPEDHCWSGRRPGHADLGTAAASSSKMIGIQVGAISFVDEGTEKVLDVLQERAGVNTLFLAVFTYGRGIAGRQIPGQPLPDHGKQEYDLNFHGGNFATPHPQYYKNTVIKDTRAPDHGNLDILAEVLPAAKKRGMKVICWLEDVFRTDLPNIEKVQERDLYGRNAETLCVNNPDYRNFFTGLVEDYARSYDIDGIMWGSERQGALSRQSRAPRMTRRRSIPAT